MKAAIVTIGDEILIGQIIDTNSVWISQQLTSYGIRVVESCSVTDDSRHIQDTVDRLLGIADMIIITGGLGPTHDDITKKALADYFNLEMEFDQQLFDTICRYFKKLSIPVTELHRQQCYMPEGIVSLENKMGTAPGMLFHTGRKRLVSLPGVPYEMKWIFENSLLPVLKESLPELSDIYHRTIRTAGLGETALHEKIKDIVDALPDNLSLAYLPSLGHVKLRVTSRDHTGRKAVDEFADSITARLKHLVYGFDNESLESALRKGFMARSLSLSTAESCTGGFLSHRITSVPGSSDYYLGSVIAYDNKLKEKLLNVDPETIQQFGAVSEEVVVAMVKGLLEQTGSDIGIAISGIAGPGGGTAEKPVGTIWLAWGNSRIVKTKKIQLAKDRLKNIEFASITAMNSLRLFLTEL